MLKLFPFLKPDTLVTCYHCGDQVGHRHVVKLAFNGAVRDLCCHGCEAVLMMIESNGLVEDYLNSKNTAISEP